MGFITEAGLLLVVWVEGAVAATFAQVSFACRALAANNTT
jgi:hypothetical protein